MSDERDWTKPTASYRQLELEDRIRLSGYLKAGYSYARVAEKLGVHRSTVTRELRRNRDAHALYWPKEAHQRASERRAQAKQGARIIESNSDLRRYVVGELRNGLSPRQIAQVLSRQSTLPSVSHETIYQFMAREGLKPK